VKEGALRDVGHFVNKKEPITPEMLRQIVLVYGNVDASGFLRLSELANLKRNNVIFYSDHVKLVLEQSKTDVYTEGKDVIIYITDNATCPVHMLRRY
jgi:hypothetical protein